VLYKCCNYKQFQAINLRSSDFDVVGGFGVVVGLGAVVAGRMVGFRIYNFFPNLKMIEIHLKTINLNRL
jgi:hypothetical protein